MPQLSAQKIKKYLNPKQIEAMLIAANSEYIVASRGFGKSEGIDAPRLLRNCLYMPRSTGAIISPTYTKLLTNTLPAVIYALERLGYKKDFHFIIGKRPHEKLGYVAPLRDPGRYDYVMTWFNGTIVHFISFDRPMSANSMSLDWVMGFEAKYLSYEKIVTEVFPAMRGNREFFGKCPWHSGVVFTTDMPTLKSGQWIFEKEKDMDTKLISEIKSIVQEMQYYKSRKDPPAYYQKILAKLKQDLDLFRKNATLYAEYDIFDNLEIIGEKRIAQFKRDLPPMVFQTAILNQRPTKVPNGFYSALNEDIHLYSNPNRKNAGQFGLDDIYKDSGAFDGDIITDLPLCLANDYNSSICSLAVGQRVEREARTTRSLFVKTPRKIKDVTQDFCNYYRDLPNRNIIYFYDHTAVTTDAASNETFADIVINVLEANGFEVTKVYIGQAPRHDRKHMWIDLAFKGDPDYLFPTFNAEGNEYLMLAMQRTGIKIGRNGFEKDKSLEKTDDSPENPDELKTHITDAWDTLYIGMNFFYPGSLTSYVPPPKW